MYIIVRKSVYVYRWHDAGTYDAKTKTGGPNGSIRNEEECAHGANNGLKKAVDWCGALLFFVVIFIKPIYQCSAYLVPVSVFLCWCDLYI